jgi:AhpC/TSA family
VSGRAVVSAVAAAALAGLPVGTMFAAGAAPGPAVAVPAEVRICAGLDEAAPPGTGPLLLVFFSTDCHVCSDELIEARYLVEKGRWPVTVIGVTSGPREPLREFLEKHAWALPVVLDARRALFKRFKAGAAPLKALVVAGEVVYRDDPYLGLEERRKELERCLTRLFSR